MEFLKDGCKENNGDQCIWCKDAGWRGPTMARVPEPMPDRENPGHYKDVFDTSNARDTGEARPVDEFAPRANKKNCSRRIKSHSTTTQHMVEQKACALIRPREKQQKRYNKAENFL